MKFLILSVCVAMVAADVSHILNKPASGEAQAKIVRQDLDVGPDGAYQWAYETDNGIAASETGSLKTLEPEVVVEVAQGSASWTSPEGEKVSFQYVADENGYQPQGSHLPTPPPIPEAILRALQYISEHPPPQEQN